VSDSAKARAAGKAQEQLEGKRVTVGQLVEAGVHKVSGGGIGVEGGRGFNETKVVWKKGRSLLGVQELRS
jgi:hypothetical protein